MELYKLSRDGEVQRIAELPKDIGLVCAFGCFDGVHIGHRALLSEAVRVAEEKELFDGLGLGGAGYASAVWTFSEPVSKPWIISVKERLSLCGRHGIEYALCQRFEDVRTLSPEEFIEILVTRYALRWGVCGKNFRFGYRGAGDPSSLNGCICESLGGLVTRDRSGENTITKAVSVVDDVCALGGVVSSTRIRRSLADGLVDDVTVLLGREYSILGTVVEGKQLGRTISRPTANLVFRPDQLIPKRGVYFTYCRIRGGTYRGVTNVGYRPTVNDDPKSVTCETHLLDFSETVYGERAEIIFVHYLRAERSFASVKELSAQIAEDVRSAVEFFDGDRRFVQNGEGL